MSRIDVNQNGFEIPNMVFAHARAGGVAADTRAAILGHSNILVINAAAAALHPLLAEVSQVRITVE